MDDTKLKCFMILGDTLNFSRTADKVFMSQQGVSRAISSLEDELGLKLFTRSTRCVKFTSEGRSLHELLSSHNEELFSRVIQLRKLQNRTKLRIGYQNYIAFYNSIKAASEALKSEYGDLIVEPDRYGPSILCSKLASGELDMIVIYSRFFKNKENCNALPLLDIQQYMMVAEDEPVPEDDPLEYLRKLPFIMDNVDGESPKELIDRTNTEYTLWGMKGDRITTRDRDTAYSYAEMGYGVIVGTNLSSLSVGRSLKSYEIGLPEALLVIWNKNDPSPVTGKFAAALQQEFKNIRALNK